VLLREAPDYLGAHGIKHAHRFQFILFSLADTYEGVKSVNIQGEQMPFPPADAHALWAAQNVLASHILHTDYMFEMPGLKIYLEIWCHCIKCKLTQAFYLCS